MPSEIQTYIPMEESENQALKVAEDYAIFELP